MPKSTATARKLLPPLFPRKRAGRALVTTLVPPCYPLPGYLVPLAYRSEALGRGTEYEETEALASEAGR